MKPSSVTLVQVLPAVIGIGRSHIPRVGILNVFRAAGKFMGTMSRTRIWLFGPSRRR
jgi:hypothetical protein